VTTHGGTGVAPAGDHDSAETGHEAGRRAEPAGAGSVPAQAEPRTAAASPELAQPAVPETPEQADEPQAPPRSGAPAPRDTADLGAALSRLRQIIAGSRFGLETEGAPAARRQAQALAGQLDDYLRPRLQRPDGPLLVVVCGPTGAGKSTLVNSLVRAPVSPAGALRPTTRAPVLVCNPADAPWFNRPAILPGFTRTTAAPADGTQLQVVSAPALPAGLALLDAPDIDSVVDANRSLATELMDAADLWLFVTTATRYADAVPWQFLREAIGRGAGVALVLDRVPRHAERVIGRHLDQLLLAEGMPGSRLAKQTGKQGTGKHGKPGKAGKTGHGPKRAVPPGAPVFHLPESTVDHQGLLPEDLVAPLRDWFVRLSGDPDRRAAVARQTLDGALGTLPPRIGELAGELAAQHGAAVALRDVVRGAHRAAVTAVETAVREGPLLAGESLARWDELVAAGELLHAVKSRSGRMLDQLRLSLAGRELPGRRFVPAIGDALTELFGDALTEAAQRTPDGWRALPGGAVLASEVDSPVVEPAPADAVREWLDSLLEMVEKDTGQRSVARPTPHTLSSVRLLVLVAAVVAPSRSDATGTERALLDTVQADPVVRRLAPQASRDLLDRFRRLIDQQRRHYDAAINRLAEDAGTAERLRTAGLDVAAARAAAELATEPVALPPVNPPRPDPAPPAGPTPDPAYEPRASGPMSSPDEAVPGHDAPPATDADEPAAHEPKPEGEAAGSGAAGSGAAGSGAAGSGAEEEAEAQSAGDDGEQADEPVPVNGAAADESRQEGS
jgi:energy-coupling factor transporter ATP-binding protein EcfA2